MSLTKNERLHDSTTFFDNKLSQGKNARIAEQVF